MAQDLGIIEAEGTVGGPLLLEVIRRCQQKEKGPASVEVSILRYCLLDSVLVIVYLSHGDEYVPNDLRLA